MDSAEQPNSTSLLPAAALLPAAHDQTSDAPSAVSAVIGDIAKIAWPVILSNMVGWSSSFFGLWLLADAGDSASLAAYGLATALCNVTGHAFYGELAEDSIPYPRKPGAPTIAGQSGSTVNEPSGC